MAAKWFMHAVSDVSCVTLDGDVCLRAEVDVAYFFSAYGMRHLKMIGGDLMCAVRS